MRSVYNVGADALSSSLRLIAGFIGLLWFIKAVELALQEDLHYLGIYPRTLKGSIGIVTGPLIHGDVFHLLSNSIPIILLGTLLFLLYRKIALDVFFLIYLLTGILVWAFARDSYHIGASGIVYGLFGFLFLIGILLGQRNSMLVSATILLVNGGIFYGLFPNTRGISWESHVFGLMVGCILACFYKMPVLKATKVDPSEENPINFTNSQIEYKYEYKENEQNQD